jgi:hypothetical protein
MFDIELMRHLSIVATMTEAELEAARANRDFQDLPTDQLEGLEATFPVPKLTDEEVAALVSDEARLIVVGFEVSDRTTYERKYVRPEWPGGVLGITIGIGYDVGYHSQAEVRADWQGLLSANDIEQLVQGVALKGERAHERLSEFSNIKVPWDAALEAYRCCTIEVWPTCARRLSKRNRNQRAQFRRAVLARL